jgi:ribosomal protein S18 acetylase RimI-like enzyme
MTERLLTLTIPSALDWEALLSFVEEYSPHFQRESASRLMRELAEPHQVVDLAVDGVRAILGAVIDSCENATDAADLVTFAVAPSICDDDVANRYLQQAEQIASQGRHRNLEIADEDLVTVDVVKLRGYSPRYRLLHCEASVEEAMQIGSEVEPLDPRWAWTTIGAADVFTYYELVRAAMSRTPGVQIPPFDIFARAALSASIPARLLWIEGQPGALVSVRVGGGAEPRGTIHLLGRTPEWRGKRVGPHLVREALSLIAEHDAATCSLEVVESNPAVALYQGFGFEVREVVQVYSRTVR